MGHWFGMFCSDCGGRIPALPNIASLLVIATLAPLWWPLWKWIRPRWIESEQRRMRHIAARSPVLRIPRWRFWTPVIVGVLSVLILPFIRGPVTLADLSWIGPLAVGLLMAAIAGWVLERLLMRQPRYQPGHCRNCGYELRGLPAQVCPECGYRFSPDDQIAP